MRNPFLRHIREWLPVVLRDKVLQSVEEERLCFIGAADFARTLSDYILMEVSVEPGACCNGCGIDEVSDGELQIETALSVEVLAAGFIGAAVELATWYGDDAIAFLESKGVPGDAAYEVAAAVEIMAEKLGARGRALLLAIDAEVRAVGPELVHAARRESFGGPGSAPPF